MVLPLKRIFLLFLKKKKIEIDFKMEFSWIPATAMPSLMFKVAGSERCHAAQIMKAYWIAVESLAVGS